MGRKLFLFVTAVVVLQAIIWSRLPETSHPADCKCGEISLYEPTTASTFMPSLCRKVVISHQQHISTTVYDCGSDTGSVAVLLHGFPDTPETWRHQVEPLVQENFRVLIPTMRGYETSSQVNSYHVTQLANDVVCITKALNIKQYDVIGHDWGAIVGQVLAISRPQDIRTFVSVAVPPAIVSKGGKLIAEKPSQLLKSWYMLFFQIPVLPEWILGRSPGLTFSLMNSWSPAYQWAEDPNDHRMEVLDRLRSPGVAHAAVNYYRQNLIAGVKDAVSRLLNADKLSYMDQFNPVQAPISVDTLMVTGNSDGCMDTDLYDIQVPGVFSDQAHQQTARLEGGHYVHYENPALFNEHVIRFLTRRPATPTNK